MPDIQAFRKAAIDKGIPQSRVDAFLIKKGLITQPGQGTGEVNFLERLKAGFGDEEAKLRGRQLEEQAGLRGRLDVGDIADIAGSVPSLAGFLGGEALAGPAGAIAGSAAGEAARQGIGRLLGVSKGFEPGKIAGEAVAGGLAVGAGKALKLLGGAVKKPISGLTEKGGEIILGTEAKNAIKSAMKQPELTNKFIRGAKGQADGLTIENVASAVKENVSKFSEKSIGALRSAEKKAVNKPVDYKKASQGALEMIRKTLGLKPTQAITEKSTTLNSQELRIVKNLENIISGAKKKTEKGILALRRQIDEQNFYKGKGMTDLSDRVVADVRRYFGSLISDKGLVEAIGKSSKNLDFLKKVDFGILGPNYKFNLDITAQKLINLAKGIADPNTRAATKELIKELEEKTGLKLLDALEAFNTAQRLTGAIPGLTAPLQTAGKLVERVTAKGAMNIPQMLRIPTPVKEKLGQAGRLGLFELLRKGND